MNAERTWWGIPCVQNARKRFEAHETGKQCADAASLQIATYRKDLRADALPSSRVDHTEGAL